MGQADAGSELRARIARDPIQPREIAGFLDGLASAERIEAVRSLGRSEQRRLYAAVDGFLPLQLADLVPPGCADLARFATSAATPCRPSRSSRSASADRAAPMRASPASCGASTTSRSRP